MSDALNGSLERLVTVAAKRETDNLMDAFSKLSATNPDFSTAAHPVDAQSAKAAREAFALAFEKVALPKFEDSMSGLLKDVAASVEQQVEERLLTPSASVVSALEGAADSLRTAKTKLADMTLDPDAASLSALQAALDAADVSAALKICADASPAVQTKAVDGVLASDAVPDEVFGDEVPGTDELVKLMAAFSMQLTDRPDARLHWLMGLASLIEDVDEAGSADANDAVYTMLQSVLDRLKEFLSTQSPNPPDAKNVKFLIRVVKSIAMAFKA